MNAIKDQHGRIWKFDTSYYNICKIMSGSGSEPQRLGVFLDGRFYVRD